jgi:hypothetical protein
MSDEQPNVRRLGRKDRKKAIQAEGALFPPDTPETEPDEPPPASSSPALSTLPQPARKTRGACLPNLVALLFLLATIAVGAYYALIAANPYTQLNPFPPFTPLPRIITATFLPPTPTLTPLPAPTATFTPLPVEALGPVEFALANQAPIYIPNANNQGCNWSSIAGTVTDVNGRALDSYQVHVIGSGLDEVVYSGSSLTYGPGGFELPLGGVAQERQYIVQLLTPQGAPASPEYSITTRATCDQNVALLSFVAR